MAHRFLAIVGVAVLSAGLGGCATVRGSQPLVSALVPAAPENINTHLRCYHGPEGATCRSGMNRFEYRNYVMSIYSGIVENNYSIFVDQLQSSDRGSALGLDLLLLGLTGATSLVDQSSVDDLATITAVAAGARATIDKELFFDRTLPAVIAAMDAERAEIRGEIARKRALPAERYSLDDGLDDLHDLQRAGRLNRGFARIARVTEQDRAREQQELSSIAAACDVITPTTSAMNQEFRQLVLTNDARQPGRLAAAAGALNIVVTDAATLSFSSIRDQFETQLCNDVDKRAFIDALRAKIATIPGG